MAEGVAEMQTLFEVLRMEIQTLTQTVQRLQNQVDVLSQRPVPPPIPPVVPVPVVPPRRKCFVAMPEKFWGDHRMFPAFLSQVRLFINAQLTQFPGDVDKVAFLCSLLAGPAAVWVSPLLDRDDPILLQFDGFCAHLRRHFADPVREQTATRALKQLRQGSRPLVDYIRDFRELMGQVQWNESALREAFQDGLSDIMLDELVHEALPDTLDALVQHCLAIEARLLVREVRRAGRSSPRVAVTRPPPVPWRGGSTVPMPTPAPVPRRYLPPLPPRMTERAAAGEPMEVGFVRSRQTPEERARRRAAGLCYYCGGAGHFANVCPQKRRSTVAAAVPVPPSPPDVPSTSAGQRSESAPSVPVYGTEDSLTTPTPMVPQPTDPSGNVGSPAWWQR